MRKINWGLWALWFIVILAFGAIIGFYYSTPKEVKQAITLVEGVENIEDLEAKSVGFWEVQIIETKDGKSRKAVEENPRIDSWIPRLRMIKAETVEIQKEQIIMKMEACPETICIFCIVLVLVDILIAFLIARFAGKKEAIKAVKKEIKKWSKYA